MSDSETQITQAIRLAVSNGSIRLWKNNVGKLRDHAGRIVSFGLATGSPDLVGLKSVYVSPDMIGRRIAILAGLEVKSDTGRIRPEQQRFLDMLNDFGAIAGIARSVEDAKRVLGV